MRKWFWLFIMLVIAGCGSGGGTVQTGGTTGGITPPSVGEPGVTGSISLRFVEAPKTALQKALPLDITTPGRARIVLKSTALKFRKVVDVAFGTTLEPIALPVAADYTIEAVFYAKGTGAPNQLSRHGATGDVVNVPAGGVTEVVLPMAEISVPFAPPTEVLSGTSYTVPEPSAAAFAAQGLQTMWALSKGTQPFTARMHLSQTPSTMHANIAAPIVGQPGFIYFQGEFFIKSELLDAGESAYDWSYVSEPPVPTQLKLASLTFPADALPPDTIDPVVRSFTVPTTKLPFTLISPINIVGADNAGIAGYLITETADQPLANDTRWSATMPVTYDFTGTVVHGTDNLVHLYAWVKDPSGRVSSANAGVSDKTVILNCAPTVSSFTAPRGVEFDTAEIPVTIVGKSYNHGTLQYLISETTDRPAFTDPRWQFAPAGLTNFEGPYTVTSVNQQPGMAYMVNLYAWVKDEVGMSEYTGNSVSISDVPQVTSFAAPTPVITGTTVDGIAISAVAAPGRTITGYLITNLNLRPAATAFLDTAPTSFTYPGLTPGTAATRGIYAWVKDNTGQISQAKGLTVRFMAP